MVNAEITPAQLKLILRLVKEMTPHDWAHGNFRFLTGLEHLPTAEVLRGLSKDQAKQVIHSLFLNGYATTELGKVLPARPKTAMIDWRRNMERHSYDRRSAAIRWDADPAQLRAETQAFVDNASELLESANATLEAMKDDLKMRGRLNKENFGKTVEYIDRMSNAIRSAKGNVDSVSDTLSRMKGLLPG